jgi:hypothetical protein
METAKVDIRKLQLLNDRINQCIDALNQVRLSVHGLTATQGPAAGINPATVGLSHSSFGQTPFAGMGIPNPASYGQPGLGSPYGAFAPFTPGIAHSTAFSPQVGGGFGNVNPFSGFSPEAYEASLRPVWADPLLTARIQQTFPYAQLPVPPVVTIY